MSGGSLKINGEAALHWASGTLVEIGTVAGPVRPALRHIIEIVRTAHDISIDELRGHRQRARLVNARSCIAVLAKEFFPDMSYRAISNALLRADGWVEWAISRHTDRLVCFGEYKLLYDYAREQVAAVVNK